MLLLLALLVVNPLLPTLFPAFAARGNNVEHMLAISPLDVEPLDDDRLLTCLLMAGGVCAVGLYRLCSESRGQL